MRRIKLWREARAPRGAVVRRCSIAPTTTAPTRGFEVVDPTAAPWLFEGTGLQAGSTLGRW